MIHNNPTDHGPHIADIRAEKEQRARWLYFLVTEARKRGHSDEFALAAIRACGQYAGGQKTPTTDTYELAKAFTGKNSYKVFEIDETVTEDELNLEFHYCPLVAAWQKLTDDEALIADLCAIAMEGDFGEADMFPAFEFTLSETIAKGDRTCKMCFRKKEQ
ncbi:MAG: L-2-amino-thiazoline-4-carboxylic acid hydrolase [Oscillospiraceae bacterium]|nr:L-2-amino-thiazoline-4-carboxylic acid hydrolase [Oscillospiraceae bacterium]